MRRSSLASLCALLCCLAARPAPAQTPALQWVRVFPGNGLEYASAMAQRSTKVWVGGSFSTTITLGAIPHSTPFNSFISQFSSDGVYQWSVAFNVGGGALIAVGVDTADNVYITGQFDGTVNFGGSALTSAGSYDIFLAKYNSAGVHQWSKKFGDVAQDTGLALVVDNANNVIIGGRFAGSTDFGGGALVTAGGNDAFIAKFNSAGTHVWSKKFGDASSQEVDGLASANGDVYATGSFFGTINLGGSALTSAGQNDIFLARFNSAGTHQWSQRYGDATFQYAIDVDTDGSSVVLLANLTGSANFGGSTLTSAGSADIAVARFLTSGVHTWSKRYGDQDVQTAAAVDLAGGNIFLTGWFEGGLNFGAHPLSAGASQNNIFAAKLFGGDGSEVWSQSFGMSGGSDFGADVVSDGSQSWFAGRFDRDANFGYNGTVFSPARDADAYLLKFGNVSAEPAIREVDDVANDQGGKVRVRWTRADYDVTTSILPITGYEIYLRDDPLNLRATRTAAAETWILAGEAPAHGSPEYYALAFSQQDSIAGAGHTSVYKVRALTDDPAVYFDSPARGGFSLDNLAPAVPLNFTIAAGTLSWSAPPDDDVAYYSVYGSAGAFDESAQLIDYTTSTRMDVAARAFAHYYVTATDRAGNESSAATLDGPGAGTPATPHTLSVSAYPNPFNPATTIRYTVPTPGHVFVDVFNVSGGKVRSLVDEDSPAGAFTARWDGRNDAGQSASSGIYFVRVEHAGATRAYKLVMLK